MTSPGGTKRKLQDNVNQLESELAAHQTADHAQLKNLYQRATKTSAAVAATTAAAEVNRSSMITSIAQLGRQKGAKLPPQEVFKYKVVLIGHQEVGKTSLRLCFQSDPLFFKKLPDVQSTTGIEEQAKVVSVDGSDVDLSVLDFAGQESYHSHTLFLTQRSVFVLVWKISAVEQDFASRGISDHEEARLCRWITEVYSKFPKAPVALCATHLDELRDQSQRSVEAILNKVGNIIQNFIMKISEGKSQMPLVGNFAVSCKNRVFTGTGSHAKMAGSKMSVLLGILAKVALMTCKADPVFWGGAIPGRHIRLIQEVQELQKKNETMLLALSDFIRMGVRIGIESDQELLEVAQLMHSWNILFMFNQHQLAANVFLFLHPGWLCKLAGVLFSFAHVINTPLHLRSVIGGLEYGVSNAEGANMGLLETGFLRFPLVRVIFRKSLTQFLSRDPHDGDMELVVQLLVALELLVRKSIETPDGKIIQVETPSTVPIAQRKAHQVTRYFVPSLSPFTVPAPLRRLAPAIFSLGVHIRFDFSFLPDEFWWRLQHRLHRFAIFQAMACGNEEEFGDDDEDRSPGGAVSSLASNQSMLFQLKEATEIHNYWRDGMWLGLTAAALATMPQRPAAADAGLEDLTGKCRVLLVREWEPVPAIRLYSASPSSSSAASPSRPPTDSTDSLADDNDADAAPIDFTELLLHEIEHEMTELLVEYQGLKRHVRVQCPEPSCRDGWFDLSTLPSEGSVLCKACKKQIATSVICVSGAGPMGRRVFPIDQMTELRQVAHHGLDDDLTDELMKCAQGERVPQDLVRIADDLLVAVMHKEAIELAEKRNNLNTSFGF